jgi:Domain of unknown function (DUF4384)
MSKLRMIMNVCVVAALTGVLGGAVPAFGQNEQSDARELERDLTVAQKPIFQAVQQLLGVGRMEVDAWVDNRNLTYAVGQPLRVMVRPHQDAYITVVDVGSSGRVAVLYPNHFQRDARVKAGSTVKIPGDRAGWQINVNGPAGVDLIQVIASRRPLTLPELNQLVRTNEKSPLITLGRSAEEFARDLVPQLKPQTASAASEQTNFGVRNLLVRVVAGTATQPAAQGQPGQGFPVMVGLPPAATGAFGLTVRPERPAYRIGEVVRILVASQNDCRLTLINVGPSGNAVQLFPNSFQRENLVRAGQIVMVPAPQSPLQIVARGPAGVEGIMAICRGEGAGSPYASDPGQSGFATIGNIQTIGRDLMASATGQGQAPTQVEQASTSYLVVE